MSSQTDPRSQLAQQIAAAVQTRLGRSDPEILAAIEQEVDLALGDKPPDLGLLEVTHQRQASNGERIVVTSTGRNQSGIVARLAKVIDEFNGDIRDLSQTIVGDYFTMIFVVDISGSGLFGTQQGSKLDFDLVDADGNVRVLMRGAASS
jgi:ACT domain-containing protein